jgi:DNA modification methylase
MPKTKDDPKLKLKSDADKVEEMEFEPIQGYPMLHWRGKRPYKSTRYYPAQLKEVYGQPTKGPDGKPWINRIYWGDNREVMSHLLREFRGKVDLVYIDPPFDSRVEYKKAITIKGNATRSDHSAFEEKQYTDIWTNDEYLQFMYERLVLIRELLSNQGTVYVHCDSKRGHFLKCILEELFGASNFINEITWHYYNKMAPDSKCFPRASDKILSYSKFSNEHIFHKQMEMRDTPVKQLVRKFVGGKAINVRDEFGNIQYRETNERRLDDVWRISMLQPADKTENTGYPTQKPESLIERIISASSNPDAIIFDCFMGSGTTQAVAMKLGLRFIGADINLVAIHTTVKRLNKISEGYQADKNLISVDPPKYLGFQVYHVNNYEIFKNPIEAKSLLVEALELDAYPAGHLYDGQKDGWQYKIMPVNHIASKADLNELLTGFDQRLFARRQKEAPNKPVEKITLVCMGHEPDLAAHLKSQLVYNLDVEVIDILRDRQDLEFKRDSVAKVKVKKGQLIIERFYPQNLLQKLSLQEKDIEDWRQLVETVAIDWNYTGEIMAPAVFDNPGKNELVQGRYKIPGDAGHIRLKITDLISESLEMDVKYGQD